VVSAAVAAAGRLLGIGRWGSVEPKRWANAKALWYRYRGRLNCHRNPPSRGGDWERTMSETRRRAACRALEVWVGARQGAIGWLATAAYLIPVAAASWLAMMAIHEFGHVLNAWSSGGRVDRVRLHPLAFSHTELSANPHPLVVAWGGLIWGSLIPLAVLVIPAIRRTGVGWHLRFFAGFCLIANGAYAASGIIEPVGDALDIIGLGTPPWALALFGLSAMGCGLVLWHGLSRPSGPVQGEAAARHIRLKAVGLAWAILAVFVAIMLLVG